MDTSERIDRLKVLVNHLWTDTQGALTYNDININLNAIAKDITKKDEMIKELEKAGEGLKDCTTEILNAQTNKITELEKAIELMAEDWHKVDAGVLKVHLGFIQTTIDHFTQRAREIIAAEKEKKRKACR